MQQLRQLDGHRGKPKPIVSIIKFMHGYLPGILKTTGILLIKNKLSLVIHKMSVFEAIMQVDTHTQLVFKQLWSTVQCTGQGSLMHRISQYLKEKTYTIQWKRF